MRSLNESLFDVNIIEKSLFDDETFKKWINQPNILWYIYYYWESDEDDWLDDFNNNEWKKYKPLVDEILKILTDKMGSGNGNYTWYLINFDAYDYDTDVSDKFTDYEEFEDMMNDANYEILKKSTEEKDGISKSWFKGPLPKSSNITALFHQLECPFVRPGKIDSGIFLTNDDTIIFLGFPKGLNKNILKIFNLA